MPAARTTKRPRPPTDGSLPCLVGQTDWQAEYNASEPILVFPHPEVPGENVSITYAEFAVATHRIAHSVRPGREGQEGEVMAMLLHCDTIVYQAMIVGLVRAGFIVRVLTLDVGFS